MTLQQNIGRAIQQLRKEQSLSQEQLALKAEIDRRYMSDIENGKRNISLDILERLAAALSISLSELVRQAEKIDIPRHTLDELKQWLVQNGHEETVVFESPDYLSAIVGMTDDGRLIYSYDLMLNSLLKDGGLAWDDAVDYLGYNTIRSLPYASEKAPVVLYEVGLLND